MASKKAMLRFLLILWGILFFLSNAAAQQEQSSILVLHSYHKGLSWTDAITEGLETTFRQSGFRAKIVYEYMDTKRYFSANHYALLTALLESKYDETSFDLIIASDDNAYRFLLHQGVAIFGKTPVVFCGVNNFHSEDLQAHPHFTGVQEDFDFGATIKVALRLQDKISKILVIVDTTTSGMANKEKLMSLLPNFPNLSFEFMENYTMEEVQRRVAGLDRTTVVLWLHFTTGRDGNYYTFEESAERISRASVVPLYSSWDFHMNHGIVGGMITSGKEQGVQAAKLALRIVGGENPASVPVVSKSPNRYMFDYKQLSRFNIDRERIPANSVVINEPENLLIENKEFIFSIIGGFVLLLSVILMLTASNLRRQKAERAAISARNRYLRIFNDTSVALLVEDFSALTDDLVRIKEKSSGDFHNYLAANSKRYAHLGSKIHIRDANPAALSLYGIDRKDDLEGGVSKVVVPESGNTLHDFLTVLLRGERRYVVETLNRRLTGEIRNVIVDVQMPDDLTDYHAVLVSIIDITKRKKAENALVESESRFRTAFNSAATGMAILSTFGDYQKVNRVICEKLGYRESELLGLNWRDVTHPDDVPACQERLDLLMQGKSYEPQEKRYLSKTGETIWVLMSVALLRDSEGNGVNFLSQFQDITPRKEMEDEMLRQKERYQKIFDDDLSGVFVVNSLGNFLECNQSFREMFGLDQQSTLDQLNFFQFFSTESDRHKFFNSMVLRKRLVQYELSLQRLDGSPLNVVVNAIGRFNRSGKLREIQGYVMDMTQQKALELQLLQAQKLESIGTMAGGVAHDFNNLLMGVLGNTSLLMLHKEVDHPDYERLKNIEEYVRSGSSLTRQLLGFAKGGKYEVRTCDINEIINHNSTIFRKTHKEVELVLSCHTDSAAVDVDRSQIDQVMYNLYVNAWQAMVEGGKICVRTTNIVFTEEEGAAQGVKGGRYVKIEVEDDGEGMDPPTLQRIFDPFFTTKEISRGVGLGLASSYGIIQNHGGSISATSNPGQGTIFTIYLPESKGVAVEQQKNLEKEEIATGKGTILLVDDEKMILDVGEQMLSALGYQVECAQSGREAVQTFGSLHYSIDLVILDMIMPGMSGGETFDALKKIDRSVKVLLSSGYSLDSKANLVLERGCCGFLQKPFDLKLLSEKVRQILESSPPE